jgi:hypothetical protein
LAMNLRQEWCRPMICKPWCHRPAPHNKPRPEKQRS